CGPQETSGEVAMLCDKYQEALTEAAASGITPGGIAGEHLKACARCGQFLAAQEAAFALVDLQLRRTANPDVPRNFEQRALSAMGKESLQKRRAFSPMFGFAAMAVAAALALAVVRTPDRNREPGRRAAISVIAPVSTQKSPATSS